MSLIHMFKKFNFYCCYCCCYCCCSTFFIYGKRNALGWYDKLTSKLRFSDRLLRLWNYYFIIFLGRLYCVYYFFVSCNFHYKIVHFSAHISVLGQNIINSASCFPYSIFLKIDILSIVVLAADDFSNLIRQGSACLDVSTAKIIDLLNFWRYFPSWAKEFAVAKPNLLATL